jgi:hypothetical protein
VRRPGKPDPSAGQTGSVAAPIEDGSLKKEIGCSMLSDCCARNQAEPVTAAKYRAAATATRCRGKCGRAAARSDVERERAAAAAKAWLLDQIQKRRSARAADIKGTAQEQPFGSERLAA